MKKTRVGLLTGQAKNATLVEAAIHRRYGRSLATLCRATGLHERSVYRALRALKQLFGARMWHDPTEGYGISIGLSSLDLARGDAFNVVDALTKKALRPGTK